MTAPVLLMQADHDAIFVPLDDSALFSSSPDVQLHAAALHRPQDLRASGRHALAVLDIALAGSPASDSVEEIRSCIRRRPLQRAAGGIEWASRPACYLQTNVVTEVAPSEAVKVPPVTVTAVPALRLSLAEVTLGVQEAGARAAGDGDWHGDCRRALVDGNDDRPARAAEGRQQDVVLVLPVTSTIT